MITNQLLYQLSYEGAKSFLVENIKLSKPNVGYNLFFNYFLMIIPWAKPLVNKKDIRYLNKAVNSQWIAKGEYVQNFEKKLNSLDLLNL